MSDREPRVSIGLPVYNGENFLERAIDSILAQTFTDFELIISDNASTDRTEEICRNYAAKDHRVRYHRNPENIGLVPNFNQVFRFATGEYFKWLAHDDVCEPAFIARCVETLDNHPEAVLSYPKTRMINEFGKPIKDDFSDDMDLRSVNPFDRYKQVFDVLLFNPQGGDKISPLFAVVRREALAKTPQHGGFNAADYVLLAELALLGQFHEVPEYLFLRREHPYRSVRMAPGSFSLERAIVLDPANRGKLHTPGWRLVNAFFAAIDRVPMTTIDKIRCYWLTGNWFLFRWGLKRIVKELVEVFKQLGKPGNGFKPDKVASSIKSF